MPVLYDYFGFSLTAPLGSIPEMSAESCREIKMSEGKAAISSKYWLDPNRSGKAALLYMEMYVTWKWKVSAQNWFDVLRLSVRAY